MSKKRSILDQDPNYKDSNEDSETRQNDGKYDAEGSNLGGK